MGSTERIRNVAKRVAKWARAGHQMVVVPSARTSTLSVAARSVLKVLPVKPDSPDTS